MVLLGAPALFAAVVGPDAFGYTATDETAYSFVDISHSGIRALAGTDDATAIAGIGFPFLFYGQSYTAACISSNGFLTFNGCSDAFANQDLSVTKTPGNLPLVAPYWSDLTFLRPNADAVYYQTLGAAPGRQFVVQWNSAFPQNAPQAVTLQVILYEGTNEIRFQYAKVDVGAGDPNSNGGAATVGICNAGGQASKQCVPWSYNAPVLRGSMAILMKSATVAQLTANLVAMVKASSIPANIQHELLASLDAALAAFARGNQTAGLNQVKAFENKVRAQAGKKIDQATADKLIAAAEQIAKS
jgi:hypothetical protein